MLIPETRQQAVGFLLSQLGAVFVTSVEGPVSFDPVAFPALW